MFMFIVDIWKCGIIGRLKGEKENQLQQYY